MSQHFLTLMSHLIIGVSPSVSQGRLLVIAHPAEAVVGAEGVLQRVLHRPVSLGLALAGVGVGAVLQSPLSRLPALT